MLKEFYIDVFSDGGAGIVIGICIWIITLLLASLLFLLIFRMFDTVGLEKQIGYCNVINKEYHKAYTTYTSVSNGKTTTTMPIRHPERWEVEVNFQGETDSLTVKESYYNEVNVGDQKDIEYIRGRFSKKFYLINFLN